MTPQELVEILKRHERYAAGQPNGTRAILENQDLSGLRLPGLRVRTHYSHQMTVAARAIAAMKFLMLRSKRVAIRRQSLRRQNMRSMMLCCL